MPMFLPQKMSKSERRVLLARWLQQVDMKGIGKLDFCWTKKTPYFRCVMISGNDIWAPKLIKKIFCNYGQAMVKSVYLM